MERRYTCKFTSWENLIIYKHVHPCETLKKPRSSLILVERHELMLCGPLSLANQYSSWLFSEWGERGWLEGKRDRERNEEEKWRREVWRGLKERGRGERRVRNTEGDEQMDLHSYCEVILEVISSLTNRTGCWGQENLREQNSLWLIKSVYIYQTTLLQ